MNHRLAAAAVLALLLAPSTPAFALGAVVTSPPGASSAVSVREAVSAAGGRTVRWGSVEVRGTASTVAWIIPVRQGAALDLTSDAWLEALEAASAPRVVPPDVDPPCGITGGVEVEGDFTHTATAAPGAVAVAEDRASLDASLAGLGLSLTSDLAPSIDAAFAAGDAMVVLVYTQAPSVLVTRTIRVVDSSPPRLPLALVEAGSSPVSITAFALGDGSVALGAPPPVSMNASAVVWRNDGTSTYASERDALLEANPGAWLFETGGHAEIFEGTPLRGGGATAALTNSYYFRAASYADATSSPDDCANAASAIAQSDATVAAACPAGALARLGGASTECQELVGAGELDPSQLRCGGIADDLAMAMAGLAPGHTWLTRARASLAPWTTGHDSSVTGAIAAASYGPVVTASAYAEPCATTAPSAPGNTGSGGSGQSTGVGGGGSGTASGGGTGDPGGSGGVIVGVTAATDVTSAAVDSSGGCSGDSSDSSDSSGSCGGDSSSSSDSSGSCSGSSSSSSDSSSGGSCDGSTSSTDTSNSSCSVTPRRRGHASRMAMLLVACAALARRRSRHLRRKLPMTQ